MSSYSLSWHSLVLFELLNHLNDHRKTQIMGANLNSTIALFHLYRLNRRVVIKLLSDEFICAEIEDWNDVKNCVANTVIVMSPELLFSKVGVKEMMEVFFSIKAKVIVITYNEEFEVLGGKNVTVLYEPTVEELCRKVKSEPVRIFLKEVRERI